MQDGKNRHHFSVTLCTYFVSSVLSFSEFNTEVTEKSHREHRELAFQDAVAFPRGIIQPPARVDLAHEREVVRQGSHE